MSKYFKRFNDKVELDWYEKISVNEDLNITLLSAFVGKRTLFDTNKKL